MRIELNDDMNARTFWYTDECYTTTRKLPLEHADCIGAGPEP